MHTFTACGRTVTVFPAGVPDAPVVLAISLPVSASK